MKRELALKIVLAVVGLLFVALGYPMLVFIRQEPALSMQFSLYVTLGVFLLLAIRNPSASRSVIAFTAWSSFAHAALMGTQACRNMVARGELIGVAVLVIVGGALIALAPPKQLLASASHPGSIHVEGSLPNGRSGRSQVRRPLSRLFRNALRMVGNDKRASVRASTWPDSRHLGQVDSAASHFLECDFWPPFRRFS
jgi:uncharacterized protein DUF6632